jgi:hypothetical protein
MTEIIFAVELLMAMLGVGVVLAIVEDTLPRLRRERERRARTKTKDPPSLAGYAAKPPFAA